MASKPLDLGKCKNRARIGQNAFQNSGTYACHQGLLKSRTPPEMECFAAGKICMKSGLGSLQPSGRKCGEFS